MKRFTYILALVLVLVIIAAPASSKDDTASYDSETYTYTGSGNPSFSAPYDISEGVSAYALNFPSIQTYSGLKWIYFEPFDTGALTWQGPPTSFTCVEGGTTLGTGTIGGYWNGTRQCIYFVFGTWNNAGLSGQHQGTITWDQGIFNFSYSRKKTGTADTSKGGLFLFTPNIWRNAAGNNYFVCSALYSAQWIRNTTPSGQRIYVEKTIGGINYQSKVKIWDDQFTYINQSTPSYVDQMAEIPAGRPFYLTIDFNQAGGSRTWAFFSSSTGGIDPGTGLYDPDPNKVWFYRIDSASNSIITTPGGIQAVDTTFGTTVSNFVPDSAGQLPLQLDRTLSYQITASADGYSNTVKTITAPLLGAYEIQMTPGNPNASRAYMNFYAWHAIWETDWIPTYGVYVTVDGVTGVTNDAGFYQVDVEKNTPHTFTVSGTGYISQSGTFNISADTRKDIYLTGVTPIPTLFPTTGTTTAPTAGPTGTYAANYTAYQFNEETHASAHASLSNIMGIAPAFLLILFLMFVMAAMRRSTK